MICFPNAKINLGLQVGGLRIDGYHNIESILVPIPYCDVLEFFPAASFSLQVSGLDIPCSIELNLVTQAWSLLNKEYGIPPINAHLLKIIPPGSGLGGGSSDASSLLIGLNCLFNLDLNVSQLSRLSALIGSDCPFFIENRPSLVSGRGEIIQPIDERLQDHYLLVAHPGFAISTKDAFEGIKPKKRAIDLLPVYQGPMTEWKQGLGNDFEDGIFNRHPELRKIKETLYAMGAVYASLTGSGSAVYGLFSQKPDGNSLRGKYLIQESWL